MRIERHVVLAIDELERRNLDAALMHSCIALDGTAKKFCGGNTRKQYKDLIRNHIDIVEEMMCRGVNLSDTIWNNLNVTDGNGKIISAPDFADVVYHIFRCNLVHCDDVPPNYDFTASDGLNYRLLIASGKLHLPDRIVAALTAVSVFCPSNKDIVTESEHYLTWASDDASPNYKFPIRDNWGQISRFREVVGKYPVPRVTLKELHLFEKLPSNMENSS